MIPINNFIENLSYYDRVDNKVDKDVYCPITGRRIDVNKLMRNIKKEYNTSSIKYAFRYTTLEQ